MRLTFLRLLPLLLASTTAAQISFIPLTGCDNFRTCGVRGQPSLGNSLTVACFAPPEDLSILLIGPRTPRIPLNPPLACPEPSNCSLDVAPAVVVSQQGNMGFPLAIPNDPALIGACFFFQGAVLDLPRSCLVTSQVISVCVQR